LPLSRLDRRKPFCKKKPSYAIIINMDERNRKLTYFLIILDFFLMIVLGLLVAEILKQTVFVVN